MIHLLNVLIISLTLLGCSHAVYQAETKPEFEDRVEKIVQNECRGKCALKYCWLETKEIPFCKLEFFSLNEAERENLTDKLDLAMQKRNLKMGFCGANGKTNSSASSFLGILGSGLAAAADHGAPTFVSHGTSPSETVTTSSERAGINEDILWKACASEPAS